jgi:rhodanese-related sulfurtransferase
MPLQITPLELKARLDAGEALQVIDVRNDWELAITSVPFAKHIVLDDLPQRLDEVAKGEPIVVMCRSGGRSMHAALFLEANGWENIINLEGGILGWARDVDPSLPTNY